MSRSWKTLWRSHHRGGCRASGGALHNRTIRRAAGALLTLALSGCSSLSTPDNQRSALYSPEASAGNSLSRKESLSYSGRPCPPAGTASFIMPAEGRSMHAKPRVPPVIRFSPGDRLNLTVFGSPELSGDYVINPDGRLTLPIVGPVEATGLSTTELTSRVERAFVRGSIYTKNGIQLSIRPVLYAPVNVTVAGAVFFPGRHAIGGLKDADKTDKMLTRFGDNPMERFVPAALRAAGGIRPDANISQVRVVRHDKTYTLDWRGAFTGSPVDDMPLIEGDHVVVEETSCFQSALARPSQITPHGIRIFYSNLSAPAYSNAQSLQSHQFSGSVPYGTRLLQGLVQSNCVGGTMTTNARRYAVLISRNPKTQETEVVQRSVEELVRSADRDTINPFLMPDDAIACYDSTVTEFRDVMAVLQAAILPANTLRGALPPR